MQNLSLYGYSVKSFMLSMIETAPRVSNNTLNTAMIEKAIQHGKDFIDKPIEMLEGFEVVLHSLSAKYKLVVVIKGDLHDQERKLKKSGIEHYFHHIEIINDKQEFDHLKLIKYPDITQAAFMLMGNLIKSDVLPVLAIGGHGVPVPYNCTWPHEHV